MFSLLTHARFLLPVGLLLVTACTTTLPAQQMSDARQALQAAEKVNAQNKAPDAYAEASRLLELARARMQSGDYQEARRLAMAAKQAALTAHDLASGMRY